MFGRSQRSAGQQQRRQRRLTDTSRVTTGLLLKCFVIVLAILFASLLSRSLSLGNDADIHSGRRDLQDGGHDDGNQNRQQKQKQKQRLVMLVGPHKSASTSVQAYLVKLAKANVLKRFNWSWTGRDNLKGFSDASRYLLVPDMATGKERKTAKVRREAQADWDTGRSAVAAAEFLDYVAAQPEREARASIKRLWDWLPNDTSSNNVEAVVMYRTPRSAHLVSAWKQQVQFRKAITVEPWRESVDKQHRRRKKIPIKPPSLAEWLCKGEYQEVMRYNISTILAAQLNPFGVAYAYHEYGGADVTMIDMAGVKDGDVPSSVVCDILKLPCTAEGKLDSNSEIVSQARNKKVEPTDLGMSDDDLNEAEEIIRDMDCYYYCQLGNNLNVLHAKDEVFADGKTSWMKCCERNMRNGGKIDGRVASERLRGLGCRAYEKIK